MTATVIAVALAALVICLTVLTAPSDGRPRRMFAVGLTIGAAVFIVLAAACTPEPQPSAQLLARWPVVCTLTWVDADGDRLGSFCEVRP